jgi:hypothetical protein
MKLKLVALIACLIMALPIALAQGRGGQGGKGQNAGYGQGQQGAGGTEMGRGSIDRQRDRVHISQQQQDQIRSCDRSVDAVRSQARQMGKYDKNGGFNADKARQDGKQLQGRVKAMQQDHERLMQGLNQGQQQALESHVRNMTQLQDRLNVHMQNLNAELGKTDPDVKPVTAQAREVERISKEWREQYRSIQTQLTTEP